MGTYNHTTTVKVLSILRDYDDAGASFVQIEQAAPEIADVRRVINNLKAQNMAYSTREENGGALYFITSDGRRVMKRYDAPEVEMGPDARTARAHLHGPVSRREGHCREAGSTRCIRASFAARRNAR